MYCLIIDYTTPIARYTSEELKYFPLNTAIFDPPKKVDPAQQQQHEVEETESQEEEVSICVVCF